MHPIHEPGSEFLEEVGRGEAGALVELYAARTQAWPHPLMYDECFTVGLFGDLASLPPHVAFGLIGAATDVVAANSDSARVDTAFDLLTTLVHTSQTTEIPLALASRLKVVQDLAWTQYSRECWASIRSWYRLAKRA